MSNSIADSYKECPRCKSTHLVRQTGADEPTCHYGRLKCGSCGRHIQWLRDPEICFHLQARANAIDTILLKYLSKLSQWEISFLQSVRQQRKLSEKQSNRLNVIGLKTINQNICASSFITD